MKAVLVNYNHDPENWWKDYGIEVEYLYDRSDDGLDRQFEAENVVKTPNRGNVDYDKLTYLVEHYDALPEVFIWGKTNLFKYIPKEEFKAIMDTDPKGFTPLLTQQHKTYADKRGQVCYYAGGMYFERNDSWYCNELAYKYPTYAAWARDLQIPSPFYLPFAPGGNYILTRETVHKYSRDQYDNMRQTLPYAQDPAEAHMCERSYYLLWK